MLRKCKIVHCKTHKEKSATSVDCAESDTVKHISLCSRVHWEKMIPDRASCTICSKIPFIPKGSRYCEKNSLCYQGLCYV